MNDRALGWLLVLGIGIPFLLWVLYYLLTDEATRFAIVMLIAIAIPTVFFVYGLHLLGVIQ